MELSLTFLGTSAASPTARRNVSATLLTAGGTNILVDCGEGTQRQLLASGGLPDIDLIVFTHYHADHYLGLVGLLKTFDMRDRSKPLSILGPPGLIKLLTQLQPMIGRTSYPLGVSENDYLGLDGGSLQSFPVDHTPSPYGDVSWGWSFRENTRPGVFDPIRADDLGVEPGPDFGRLQRGEVVNGVEPSQVIGPPRPGRKVVFSGDTRPHQNTLLAACNAEVLVHEATFSSADHTLARKAGHCTAADAAELAAQAQVRLLALNHISSRCFVSELRDEARENFGRVYIASDFDHIEIPFPERGEPQFDSPGMVR